MTPRPHRRGRGVIGWLRVMASYLYLIYLAEAAYNVILAAVVLWHTCRDRTGRMLAWYLLTIAAWLACTAALTQPHVSQGGALFAARGTHCFGALMVISWVWFCAGFPRFVGRFSFLALALTALGLPWLYLSWTPALVSAMLAPPWWQHLAMGKLFPLYGLWLVVTALAGIAHLVRKRLRMRGLERQQLRYILLGSAAMAVVAVTVDLVIPAVTGSTQYAPLGPLSSLFVATTATYAIVRYRLVDVRIVLRAGVVYTVTLGAFSLLFASLAPALDRLLSARVHLHAHAGAFLVAFAIALAFQPTLHALEGLLDRYFVYGIYDFRSILRDAVRGLASVYDQVRLAEMLANALQGTLDPARLAIFALRGDDLVRSQATPGWEDLPEVLPTEVAEYARAADDVLLPGEMEHRSRPARNLALQLLDSGVDVVVPLIARGQLCGVVCLGEKRSGDVYTADDIGLLRILGKQAAIALDNARHYDEVALMNEYHTRLLHAMQDGVIVLDPQRRVITFNPGAEAITGLPGASAVGQRLEAVGLTTLPLRTPGGQPAETTVVRADGGAVPVLVTVTPFLRRWEVEPSHLLVLRDLSALRALEQEKMQAERFSSMGAMAASLAHEIKNPLLPIQTFAHLLPTMYDDAEFRKEFSATVVNEVERINQLVGEMLDLVRQPAAGRAPVDVRAVVERLLEVVEGECSRHGVEVVTELARGLPAVAGLAGQLYQALLNVLTNAVQAMPTGGTLTVWLGLVGGQVCCRIQDTGPGVGAGELRRIFEPLYTTKATGHGLGLALTYQFIRSHGGEVRAECPPGSGLAVIITLPVESSPERAGSSALSLSSSG